MARQPYRVLEGQGATVNGLFYFFGGYDTTINIWKPTARSHVYDPIANEWSSIADMPDGGLTHSGAASDGTYIYLAGGYPPNSSGTGQRFATTTVLRYDPRANTYSDMPDLPGARGAGVLVHVDNYLYFVGGTDLSRNERDEHWRLDLNNLAAGWVERADLPFTRNHAGGIAHNGKIYYIGGQYGQDGSAIGHDDMQIYDIATNMWSEGSDLPDEARHHMTLSNVIIDGKIVIVGGEWAWGAQMSSVLAYDPGTDSYEYLQSLPDPEMSGVSFIIDDVLYYTGGNSRETFRSEITLANPETDVTVSVDAPVTYFTAGQTASFDVDIENTGDFTLATVNVTGSAIADCNRTINNILVGVTHSYTCSGTVNTSFTQTINVSATGADNAVVNASDSLPITVAGGFLTVIAEATPDGQTFNFNGTGAIGNFSVTDDGSPMPSDIDVRVNFQPAGSIVPIGYIVDSGLGYDAGRGYGWIRQDSIGSPVPIDITTNTRDRQVRDTDQRFDTIIHMQYAGGNSSSITTPSAWEYALPSGLYTITLGVGDTDPYDSINRINIEGARVINDYVSSDDNEFFQATVVVPVTDGHLTIDAIGGVNTKLNYVDIIGTSTPSNAELLINMPSGSYTITETVPADWLLTGITCNNVGFSVNGADLIVQMTGGTVGTCTFTNVEDTSPPSVELIAPNTVLTDSLGKPTYTWTDVPNATAYQIYIAGTDNPQVIQTTLTSNAANCSSGTCAVDMTLFSPNYYLQNGEYIWYILPSINGIAGQWTDGQAFELDVPAPEMVTLDSTTNTDTLTPTFNWTLQGDADKASHFNLYLVDGNGAATLNTWFTRAETCGDDNGTTCSYTMPNDLVDEMDYSLYIGSYGAGGSSTGGVFGNGQAGPEQFTVSVTKPQPIAPNGLVDLPAGNPMYTWTDISGASYYYLYVTNALGEQIINEVVSDAGYCNGAQCQVDMTQLREQYQLTTGMYTFYVRGWLSESNITPWSPGMSFTINSAVPGVVTKLSPEPNSVESSTDVTFTWEELASATGYNLLIVDPNGTTSTYLGDVGDTVNCVAGECSRTITVADIPGAWTWYLSAYNVAGNGPWSPLNSAVDAYGAVTFTMPVALPEFVARTAPSGEYTTDVITFEWEGQSVASSYNLYITGPNAYVSDLQLVVGQDVICNPDCELSLVMPYNGTYTWYLRAYNVVGFGPWGADEPNGDFGETTFTINMVLPDVLTKNSPAQDDILTDLDLTFNWDHDEVASKYEVYVAGPNSYVHYQPYVVDNGVVCTDTCNLNLSLPANGAYTWYVRGGNAAGWGAWGDASAFTMNEAMPPVIVKTSPLVGANEGDLDVTFSWEHASIATIYNLYMTSASGYVLNTNYSVGTDIICTNTCSVDLNLPANGAYTWYLRGGNAVGWGEWSAGGATDNYGAVAFTVGQPVPAFIVKSSPINNVNMTDLAVTFSWEHDASATIYNLYAEGPNGYVSNGEYNVGSDITCTTDCEMTLNLPANGAYLWYLRGGNAAGWGAWSAGGAADNYGLTNFTVNMPVPDVVTKGSPAESSTELDLDVAFQWTALEDASVYQLYITGPSGFAFDTTYTVDTDLTCGATCEAIVTVPANGTYTWYLRGGNAAGWGAWSANEAGGDYGDVSFLVAVQLPSAPVLLTPADDEVIYQTNRPTFSWNTVSQATYYNLQIINGMNQIVFDQWLESPVVCGASCSHQLANPIAFGGYTWQVRAYNVAGIGDWSTTRSFLSLSMNIQPLMVQVEDERISRTGAWTQQTSVQAVSDSYWQSGESTADILTMQFTGTVIDVVYVAGPAYGTFVIEIDGEPVSGINANTATTAFGQIAIIAGLSDGEHTLRIIPLGGAPVAIDALVVNGDVLTAQPEPTPVLVPVEPIVTEEPVEIEETPVVIPVDPVEAEETPIVTEPPAQQPDETPVVIPEEPVVTEETPIATVEPTPAPDVTPEPNPEATQEVTDSGE